jgi:miniconductance mechanosensitive channel
MNDAPAANEPSSFLLDLMTRLLHDWGLGATAPWVSPLLLMAISLVLAVTAYYLTDWLTGHKLKALTDKTQADWDNVLVEHRVFQLLGHLAPGLVLHLAAPLVLPAGGLRDFFQRLILVCMVLAGSLALTALISALRQIYETTFTRAGERPIRSYVQVVKVFLWLLALVLVIALLLNRSPWGLVAGLGTMSVVLLMVFKDSILGLVASIKLTADDMVRIGDWIEMPQFGADGNVTEILLTTVKVRNWDMTITTIPSYHLVSDAFKNWRGMSESGVRRIRRPILINQQSIRFVDEEMLERFKKIQYIQEYLDSKLAEIQQWNTEQKVDESSLVNGRNLTNVGTFRAYAVAYLKHHPLIREDLTLMVHQLSATEKGLPLMVYAFCTEQRWAHIEGIKADIFDHLLAVVREFDLQVVQVPTGADVRAIARSQAD